jgi:hypothetical protein
MWVGGDLMEGDFCSFLSREEGKKNRKMKEDEKEI